MPTCARNLFARSVVHALPIVLTILPLAHETRAQPSAHHSGAWTNAEMWPGRTTWPNSIWAVHMGLARGDTLFARPHSQVLAWGLWSANASDGGIWGWNPKTDSAAAQGRI